MGKAVGEQRWFDGYLAGTAGGASLTLAGHPLDTIKVRLQTMPPPKPGQAPMFASFADCAMKTLRNEGPLAFYKGVTSPLSGTPWMYAVCFGSYKWAQGKLEPAGGLRKGELLSVQRMAIAGMISGVATTVITTPVELLKSKLQVQYNRPSGTPAEFNGMMDCGVKTFRRHGLAGLYRGCVATLARDVPGSGVYFATYEVIRRKWATATGTPVGDLSAGALLVAGGMGGVANWLVILPPDVIKSRMQAAPEGTFKGPTDAVRQLLKESGVRGFYKGITPTLLRAFPANAACFYGFEMANRFLRDYTY